MYPYLSKCQSYKIKKKTKKSVNWVDQKERETNNKVRMLWLIIYLISEHISEFTTQSNICKGGPLGSLLKLYVIYVWCDLFKNPETKPYCR
jgi:hypothetical protein